MSAIAAIASQGERAEVQAPAEQLLRRAHRRMSAEMVLLDRRLACAWAARSAVLGGLCVLHRYPALATSFTDRH